MGWISYRAPREVAGSTIRAGTPTLATWCRSCTRRLRGRGPWRLLLPSVKDDPRPPAGSVRGNRQSWRDEPFCAPRRCRLPCAPHSPLAPENGPSARLPAHPLLGTTRPSDHSDGLLAWTTRPRRQSAEPGSSEAGRSASRSSCSPNQPSHELQKMRGSPHLFRPASSPWTSATVGPSRALRIKGSTLQRSSS